MCVLRRMKNFTNDKKCKKTVAFSIFKKTFRDTSRESAFHNDFASIKTQGVESWHRYSDKLRIIFPRFRTCCTIIINKIVLVKFATIHITFTQCFQQKRQDGDTV